MELELEDRTRETAEIEPKNEYKSLAFLLLLFFRVYPKRYFDS